MSSQSATRCVVVSGLQKAITVENIVQYFESQQWQGCKVVYVVYMGIHIKAKAMVGVQGVSPETLNNLSCKTHVIHQIKVKVELTDISPTPEQITSAAYSANPNSVTSATVSEDSKEVISVTSHQIFPPSVDADKLSSSTAESEQVKKNSSVENSQCSESSHSPETFSKTTGSEGPCVQPVQLTGVKDQDSQEVCDSHYITVSGLPSSIAVEDIVAYFQSARCGGGTVTKVVYLDKEKSVIIVGFSEIALTSSHKLLKGIHRIAGTKVAVEATDTALTPEQKQSAVYSYDPKPASTDSGQVKSPSGRTIQKDIPTHLEHDQTKVFSSACETLPTSNAPKYSDGFSQHETSYIAVTGLTQCMSVEDIVAHFQSARCGGGTVTQLAYVGQSKSVAFVGISGLKLNSAHKMFKGIHRIGKSKVKVEFTDTLPNTEQQMTVVYSFNVSQGSTGVSSGTKDQPKLQSADTASLKTSVDPMDHQAPIDGKEPPLPIQANGEQPLKSIHTDREQPLLPIQTPCPQKLPEATETSYIMVSGLTSSISVEDIVAYFQSARCGGGTVVMVVYQDHSKTQALVGIGKVELNTSHKLFKGKHVLNHRQVNVCLATNPLSPIARENSDLVAYVHEETNPIEGMLPNSSTTHANVMAVPNAHTPKTIPVRGPLHKYLLASQSQDVAAQELDENKHVQFINPPSSLYVSHNMSDTPTQGNNDGIESDSEVTMTAPKGMGANLHAAITALSPYTDVTVTLSSKGNIVLRGRKKGVEKLKMEVERMIHDNAVAKTVQNQSLPPQVLVYIEKCAKERLMNTHNIQFKTDIQTNTLEVFGTSASCTHFMNTLQSLNPSCVDVTLPAQGVSLLASPQGMALISNAIGQRPIGYYFTGPAGSVACSAAAASQLHLVAENYQDVVNIAQQLQNKIVVHEYPVPKQFFNLLSSSSWTKTCQTLETSFTALLTSHADKGIVTIACDKQHLENVKKGLHELCEKEGFVKEIPLQKREWEHLQHCSDWTNLKATINSSGLQVQLPSSWDQTLAISFYGEITTVRYYARKTKKIIDDIARQTRDISRPENTQPYKSVSDSGNQPGMGSTNYNTAHHPTTLNKPNRVKGDPGNHSAHPVLNAGTTGPNSSSVQPATEDTSAAKTRDLAYIIQMKRGSLTDSWADVYVNTANATLSLKLGAVAQSLLKAGGPALQAECNQYIAQHGNIPDWGYAVTGGGNLKCKHVIHAVSAFYGGQRGSASTEQAMKTMVANIMAECDRLQVSSVAFPAIGTGVLGFPDDIVAKIMLQAISSYLYSHPLSTLQRVFLVIFSNKTYNVFQSQLQTTLSIGSSGGGTSQLRSSTKPSHHIPSHTVGNPPLQPVYHGAHSSTVPTRGQSATLQSFVSNNVTIDIIHGDITREDCDGIVSTSSPDLTLHPVGVMGALLKKGGTELQQECTAAVTKSGHLFSSKVIVTGTGKTGGLKCRKILHILAPDEAYDLQKVVKAVLREADKESLSIVSLPAIGTGQHGFTPRVAAEGICEAIVEFSRSHPRHVKHVKVVLFQEEHYSSFSTAFTAASSKKGLSPLRSALSHVRSAITPGHGSTNSETSAVHRPPHTFPSHTKPQQTGHTQYAARNPADSKYTSSFTEDSRSPNFVYESTEEDKPSTWDPMPTDPLTGKENTHHLVDLPPHSGEYKEVSQAFHQTISYYKIKKIQRIQNPKLWSQYAARKKTMDRESPQGTQNERKLFHGCTEGVMQSINHSGFNALPSNAGRKASTYGKGMYFSRDASSSTVYAALCQGSRHMYLARVLTGEFTNGNYTTSIPPPKNLSNPNVLFDSVVDNIHYPCVFVVFFEDQAYPEYLITYGS